MKFQRERKNLSFLSPSVKTTCLVLKVTGERIVILLEVSHLRTALLHLK